MNSCIALVPLIQRPACGPLGLGAVAGETPASTKSLFRFQLLDIQYIAAEATLNVTYSHRNILAMRESSTEPGCPKSDPGMDSCITPVYTSCMRELSMQLPAEAA